MGRQKNHPSGKDKLSAAEQQLRATIQQLQASEQQLKAANQQLQASEQQVRAANQQLQAEVNERKKAEEALQEAHDYLDKLINYANAPIIVWDPKFRITRFNRAFERLTGYTSDEVIGQDLNMLFPQASRKKSLNKIERTLSGKYWESVDIPILCKNGQIRLALWNSANIYAKDGTTLLATIAQGQDITERKKAEEQLMAANQQLTASEQQLKAANQQLQASEQQLKASNQQLRASEQQLKAANQQLRASERQLLDDRAQLKSLASQLTLAEEHERHQIATDLHAAIGQALVVSKLQLDTLRASVPSGDIAKTLGEVCESLDETIQRTKSLTFDLSSPLLYELGFEKAVAEWLMERIQEKHGIATEFEDDGQPKPLDDDVRVFLFRDVRELLINVVKHTQAKKVKVSVRKAGSNIQVSVEDDGWGFDTKKVTAMAVRKGGFGLFSIRERLEQLGGELEVESAPGQGCRVTITAPLKGKKPNGRG